MKKIIFLKKDSQIWSIDLILSFFIISFLLLIIPLLYFGQEEKGYEKIKEMNEYGDYLIETILSEGYPQNWNTSNFIKIGILTNGRVNNTKLNNFYNLTKENYKLVKESFGIPYDFFFYLEETEGIGKPDFNLSAKNYSNIIKITRITIYEENPIKVEAFIFEE